MKKYKYIAYCLFTFLFIFYTVSCNEDKGNYNYEDISEVEIENKDVVDTIYLEPQQSIEINPKIDYTDGIGNGNFSYEWIAHERVTNRVIAHSIFKSEETPNLKEETPVFMKQSVYYDLFLVVANNITNIKYSKKYRIFIKNKLQTGYLTLSEKKNGLELDIIADYKDQSGEYLTLYRNLLEYTGSSYPKEGRKPLGLALFSDPSAPTPDFSDKDRLQYSVFILTDKSTDRLDAKDFSFKADSFNISKISPIVSDFAPKSFVTPIMKYAVQSSTASQYYVRFDDNWFFASRYMAFLDFMYPVNRTRNVIKPYKTSPYIAVSINGAVFFNEDDNCFMYQGYSTQELMNLDENVLWRSSKFVDEDGDPFLFNNPNYSLIYMDNKNATSTLATEVFAIVYNRSTSKHEFLAFTLASGKYKSKSKMRKDIPQQVDIKSIKRYAHNPSQPAIYMATDDKLYLSLTSGLTMSYEDITNKVIPPGHKISCIKAISSHKKTLRNLLAIATYDPNADLDTSGTLQFFEMNSTTGQLTLAKHPATGENQIDMKWDQFGKIVDIDYKEK